MLKRLLIFLVLSLVFVSSWTFLLVPVLILQLIGFPFFIISSSLLAVYVVGFILFPKKEKEDKVETHTTEEP